VALLSRRSRCPGLLAEFRVGLLSQFTEDRGREVFGFAKAAAHHRGIGGGGFAAAATAADRGIPRAAGIADHAAGEGQLAAAAGGEVVAAAGDGGVEVVRYGRVVEGGVDGA
jgi:hypothetical protein